MMEKLLNLGVDDSLKPFQKGLVRNSNLLSLLFLFIPFAIILILFFHQPNAIGFTLILFVSPLLTWFLNWVKLTSLSRPVFLIGGLINISMTHAYFVLPGQDVIFYFLYIQVIFFVLIWILIDAREAVILIPTVIIMLAIFFSFQLINDVYNASENVDVLTSPFIKVAILLFNISITLVTLYTVQKKNLNSQNNINVLKAELEEKSSELSKKEQELQATLNDISESHKEEDRQNWVSNGIAKINTILRGSEENIFRKILLGIIDHANLLYGGIYVIDSEDKEAKFLELKASYGYNKENIQKRRVEIDDGLLSRAYHERDIVHMIEIPEEYSKIESGLGESSPGTLVILPLIYEENIEGIMEVASFRILKDHEIEYLKRMATILARFIESHKSDTQTKELLEKTQQQTEEMRAQEEEMRQNMEELQATQEELHRKEQEYINRIKNLQEQLQK